MLGYRECTKGVDDISCLTDLPHAIVCRSVGLISLISLHQIFMKKWVNFRRMFGMESCQCVFKLTDPAAELCDASMQVFRSSQNKPNIRESAEIYRMKDECVPCALPSC